MKPYSQNDYRNQIRGGRQRAGQALILFMLLLVLLSCNLKGCESDPWDPSETYTQLSSSTRKVTVSKYYAPLLEGTEEVETRDRIELKIRPAKGAGKRDIIWIPPDGATDFRFPGKQPEWDDLTQHWVFKNVDENDDLRMSYIGPPGFFERIWFWDDIVLSHYRDGSSSGAGHRTWDLNRRPGAAPPAAPPTLTERHLAQDADTWNAWDVQLWLEPAAGITLTTELCQEWVDKLQGDEFFLAARMPMATTAVTGSYRLPFVFGTPYSQTVFLRQYSPFNRIVTATLEYRLDRLAFLDRKLPQAEGEHWAALGIAATEPISCPMGLNAAGWAVEASILLDLHDQPDDCTGCTVQVYGCYEGQNSPLESQESRALAHSLGIESYQGQGITCLGPKPIYLDYPGLSLEGAPLTAVITPTLPITMHERVYNATGDVVTLTLGYTSSVSGWQFYGGDWVTPDTNKPIIPGTTEIVIPGQVPTSSYIWAINNPVPADTPDGPHSLVITVTSTTSPTLTIWDAITLWSGEWVAPPLPGGVRRVYMPLIARPP